MNRRILSDNEQGLQSKRDQIMNNFNSSSFTVRPRTGRYFHKDQIFNNYKPFLVDGFRKYAD